VSKSVAAELVERLGDALEVGGGLGLDDDTWDAVDQQDHVGADGAVDAVAESELVGDVEGVGLGVDRVEKADVALASLSLDEDGFEALDELPGLEVALDGGLDPDQAGDDVLGYRPSEKELEKGPGRGAGGTLMALNPNQEPPMPRVSIRLTGATRKQLESILCRAFKAGDLTLVKRVTALLSLARGEHVEDAGSGVGVSASTLYTWVHAFLLEGVDGLRVQWRGGRPPKLTQTQHQRLAEIVTAGPEAAGFQTGCWHALLIQQVIAREFNVAYNVPAR
jgi:transposase